MVKTIITINQDNDGIFAIRTSTTERVASYTDVIKKIMMHSRSASKIVVMLKVPPDMTDEFVRLAYYLLNMPERMGKWPGFLYKAPYNQAEFKVYLTSGHNWNTNNARYIDHMRSDGRATVNLYAFLAAGLDKTFACIDGLPFRKLDRLRERSLLDSYLLHPASYWLAGIIRSNHPNDALIKFLQKFGDLRGKLAEHLKIDFQNGDWSFINKTICAGTADLKNAYVRWLKDKPEDYISDLFVESILGKLQEGLFIPKSAIHNWNGQDLEPFKDEYNYLLIQYTAFIESWLSNEYHPEWTAYNVYGGSQSCEFRNN